MESTVCIIGAGPAGLMAAIFSAAAGASTVVVEANTAAGRKLLLTGAGRCNLTNDRSVRELVRAYGAKGRFLSYALHEFSPRHVRDFFADRGLATKVEGNGCVFPVSNRAGDVRDVLVAQAEKLGVRFAYGFRVTSIGKVEGGFSICADDRQIIAKKVVIATGGVTWPNTGSRGDGYKFAQGLGHTIVPARPSLVPLVTRETWPARLAGTAMDNVRIMATVGASKIVTGGAMILTDDGIGGPVVLELSSSLADYLPAEEKPLSVSIDLAPDLGEIDLERRVTEMLAANPRKDVANVLALQQLKPQPYLPPPARTGLSAAENWCGVPKRLAVVLCEQAGCGQTQACQLKKDVRKKLVRTIKALPLSITAARSIEEATVTHGGVSIDQIDHKTMQSKICPGLFFAGEVIDVDGPCGGYNLQISWSTGAIAGKLASKHHIRSFA